MSKFDVIVIGSGIGGLACGAILSKEGLSVCLLEQHHTIGGCFQSFKRDGRLLDTGIHYVGSLNEGQIMHQYFKYFGIIDQLRLQKLNENGFDIFQFPDGHEFRHAMGYENFIDTLAADFPEEKAGLIAFCNTIKAVGNLISPEILREGRISNGGFDFMAMSVYNEIAKTVKNPVLQQILAGNNSLFAGNKNSTSLYEYGMITHSNIEGTYSFVEGTQQVADALANVIRQNGGQILTNAEVQKIHINNNQAEYVKLKNGEIIFAKNFISSLHPATTLALLENNTIIKKASYTRISSLENTYGLFTTYLITKPNSLKYENRNFYCFNGNDVWSAEADFRGFNIPVTLICFQANAKNEFSDVITLLTPMPHRIFSKWDNTKSGQRGADYQEFKQKFSEAVVDFVCQYRPELRSCIDKIYTASPLTYRDFTATPNGSAYGIVKDFHNPMVTHFPAKTKIANLFFTGQNLNIHGCLGTTISAATTCSELLGTEYITKKIGNA